MFDPVDMKRFKGEDTEVMEYDLPERYLKLCLSYKKGGSKKLKEIKEIFEKDDHGIEANWIFNRMRNQNYFDNYDDKLCKDRIRKVL